MSRKLSLLKVIFPLALGGMLLIPPAWADDNSAGKSFFFYSRCQLTALSPEGSFNPSQQTLVQRPLHVAAISSLGFELPSGEKTIGPKSKGKAFFLSLLLPGMGERYAGSKKMSYVFLTSEVLLWAGYGSFWTYGQWRKEDYRVFAATHAGVDLAGKTDTYFVNIGNYADIYEYNQAKLRQRNLDDYYRDTEAYFWQWDSAGNRAKFEGIRIASDRAFNRSLFTLGGILANHLISAIHAVWAVHRHNRHFQEPGISWQLRLEEFGWGKKVELAIGKSF